MFEPVDRKETQQAHGAKVMMQGAKVRGARCKGQDTRCKGQGAKVQGIGDKVQRSGHKVQRLGQASALSLWDPACNSPFDSLSSPPQHPFI